MAGHPELCNFTPTSCYQSKRGVSGGSEELARRRTSGRTGVRTKPESKQELVPPGRTEPGPRARPSSASPAVPTWQRPDPDSPRASPPPSLPLPCPERDSGRRRTGTGCAKGRRLAAGRRTSLPRLARGCPARQKVPRGRIARPEHTPRAEGGSTPVSRSVGRKVSQSERQSDSQTVRQSINQTRRASGRPDSSQSVNQTIPGGSGARSPRKVPGSAHRLHWPRPGVGSVSPGHA